MVRIQGCRGLKQLFTLCSHSVHTTKARFSFTGHIVRGCSQGSVPSTMGRPSHPHYHNQGNPSQACGAISQVMPGSVQLTADADVTSAPPWFSPFCSSHPWVLCSYFLCPWKMPACLSVEKLENSHKRLG